MILILIMHLFLHLHLLLHVISGRNVCQPPTGLTCPWGEGVATAPLSPAIAATSQFGLVSRTPSHPIPAQAGPLREGLPRAAEQGRP